jgi:GDP/UDP-N,N'-diacetylbacillosamine 2-epimerase (hydrolysing)
LKKISILTATRAEYGLLKPIIQKLSEVPEFNVRLAVTGAHLSPEFGSTYTEIEQDGIPIDKKIEMLLSADTPSAISKSMALAMIGFADYFEELQPDMLLVLGDRYETLAVSIAAMNSRIPIAHLYGGETTEGALDEAIRHAITKLSYLHFTSTEEYRRRVVQMGEEPDRVFCVGAVGIENILNVPLLNKIDLESSLGITFDRPVAVVTFHPTTMENNAAEEQFQALLDACEMYQDSLDFIFTKANADSEGRTINRMIDNYVESHVRTKAYTSLGMLRYLSVLKHCSLVIGNSSSGIIEAPSFGIPTINVGDRQKGRIRAESVFDCTANASDIAYSIQLALSSDFQSRIKGTVNPYGDGNTSAKIADIIQTFLLNDRINLKKKFYNCEVSP